MTRQGAPNPNMKRSFFGEDPLASGKMVQEKVVGSKPKRPHALQRVGTKDRKLMSQIIATAEMSSVRREKMALYCTG